MPKMILNEEFEMTTRNQYNKVEAVISITVDGKELPAMATLGDALETAIQLIQQKVTDSYKVIPERVTVAPVG